METIFIELPQVGESMVEGTIGKWIKQTGEKVEQYESLVEVTTDKINVEIPSPRAGILKRILVDQGISVPVGTIIAEIEATELVQVQDMEYTHTSQETYANSIGQEQIGALRMDPTATNRSGLRF